MDNLERAATSVLAVVSPRMQAQNRASMRDGRPAYAESPMVRSPIGWLVSYEHARRFDRMDLPPTSETICELVFGRFDEDLSWLLDLLDGVHDSVSSSDRFAEDFHRDVKLVLESVFQPLSTTMRST